MFILVRVSIVTDIQTNKHTNKQTNYFYFGYLVGKNIYTVHDTRHMKLYGALRAPIILFKQFIPKIIFLI